MFWMRSFRFSRGFGSFCWTWRADDLDEVDNILLFKWEPHMFWWVDDDSFPGTFATNAFVWHQAPTRIEKRKCGFQFGVDFYIFNIFVFGLIGFCIGWEHCWLCRVEFGCLAKGVCSERLATIRKWYFRKKFENLENLAWFCMRKIIITIILAHCSELVT